MADVSRETPPLDPAPPSAAGVFSSRLDLVTAYGELLATDGVVRGLIGPREVPRLWERHLLNCGVVAERVPPGASVADVGTGAGLPGLVWAIQRPDIHMTLIEPLLRRTTFLDEVVQSLELENVTVLRGRAEEVRASFDVVTARAVAPLERLGRWCLPLTAPGGVLLALKGSTAQEEVDESTATLQRLGARSIVVRTYGELDIPTTVVEVSR